MSESLNTRNVRPNVKHIIESLFRLYNKRAELVDFNLNCIQNTIFSDFIGQPNKLRGNIVKARQFGVSTLCMAWFLVECMTHYCRCVMLAHDKDHTEKLLRRAQLLLKHLKGPQPEITRMNDNEIGFKKTDASFYIGTAGSKTFGRSDVITHLHCSEIGFWKDPGTLLAGLLQAIPHDSGIIVKESTGNGWGTWHQKNFYNALGGNSNEVPIFLPWNIFPEYQSPLNEAELDKASSLHFIPNDEEVMLVKEHNLSLPQLKWMREKVEELNGDVLTFKQEYPLTIEDAFKLTGGSLLQPKLIESERWIETQNEGRLEGHPHTGYHYAFGIDNSGGTGNDYAAINGLCLETSEQVYRYRTNRLDPVKWARIVADKGMWFNEAFLVPERNSHGISVISILREVYSPTQIYKKPVTGKSISGANIEIPALQYGWNTTEVTKDYIIGIGMQLLIDNFKIYDRVTYDELLGFVEDAQTGLVINLNDNDDCGIAFLLGCVGLLKLRRRYASDLFERTEFKLKRPEVSLNKWRDKEGVAFVTFEDLFKTKQKRNEWSSVNALN